MFFSLYHKLFSLKQSVFANWLQHLLSLFSISSSFCLFTPCALPDGWIEPWLVSVKQKHNHQHKRNLRLPNSLSNCIPNLMPSTIRVSPDIFIHLFWIRIIVLRYRARWSPQWVSILDTITLTRIWSHRKIIRYYYSCGFSFLKFRMAAFSFFIKCLWEACRMFASSL